MRRSTVSTQAANPITRANKLEIEPPPSPLAPAAYQHVSASAAVFLPPLQHYARVPSPAHAFAPPKWIPRAYEQRLTHVEESESLLSPCSLGDTSHLYWLLALISSAMLTLRSVWLIWKKLI